MGLHALLVVYALCCNLSLLLRSLSCSVNPPHDHLGRALGGSTPQFMSAKGPSCMLPASQQC